MKKITTLIFIAIVHMVCAQSGIWSNYSSANSGLPSNTTNWLNKATNGDLYISTNAGLTKFDGSNWTTYSTSNSNIPANGVGRSRFDANGNIWFLCNGLTKFDGVNFTNYNSTNSTLPAFTYNDFVIDQNGVVWLTSTNSGLVKFDLVTSTIYNTTNSSIPTNLLRCITIETGNTLWIGGMTGGLSKFDGTNWTIFNTTNSQNPTNTIQKITISGNTKWYYKFDGLISYDNINWTFYPYTNTLAAATNIETDDLGKIWLTGTTTGSSQAIGFFNGQGISCYSINFTANNVRIKNNIIYASSAIASPSGVHYTDISTYCANGGSAREELSINNVRAFLDVQGGLWNGNTNGKPGHEFPKGDTTFSIFAGGIWVMGKSPSGKLKGAINQFTQKSDFAVGPLDHYPISPGEASVCQNYDRIWKINKSTIDSFKQGLFTTTPTIIKEWPAVGNPNLAFTINREMAPFMDVNQDYNYNPANGDYPLIKGDQALWWIVNDGKSSHMTGTEPMGIEMQFMAYAYKTNNVLNNTTFYEVKITNKSDSTINNTNVSVFVDPDLGNFSDDFVGTDSSRNMGIVYNGDAFDENNGAKGYKTKVPLVGVNMLQGPKDEFREPVKIKNLFVYNNGGNWQGNPVTPNDYWKYMNSLWLDSTHIVYGNTGHVTGGGTQQTNFLFPSDPTDINGWSECSSFNMPGDRRLLITYGSFNLIPDQTNGFTFSVVNTPMNQAGCVSFQPLLNATDSVKAFYDSTLCKNFKIEIVSQQNSTCGQRSGRAEVFASAGTPPYFYDWTSGSIVPQADSLYAGQYVINVTDVMGCNRFITVNISDNNGPTVSPSITNVNCAGGNNGAINITATGPNQPFSYLWSNGDTATFITNLEAGPYEVTVTDTLGCERNLTLNVNQPPSVILSASTVNANCNTANGAINLQVAGGTSPYNYLWSNSATSEDLTGVSAGLYTINVTDANNCSNNLVIGLNNIGGPSVSPAFIMPASCNNINGGYIDVNVLGGTTPYTFQWSNNANTEDISGVTEGPYYLSVTDNNNCVGTFTANVGQISPSGADICLVSVDTITNTNIIGWQKIITSEIDHYNIYRESSTAGIYYKIDSVPYDSLSLYVDSLSNPNIKSWRYKISVTDTCGFESALSFAQKTIHLSLSYSGNSVLLSWDHYEGFPFNEYRIYRWLASTGWQPLDSVPSNFTYYYDNTAPASQTISYSIEVFAPDTCFFTRTPNQNTSRSNKNTIANTPLVFGVNHSSTITPSNPIKIYPNPNSGEFYLELNSDKDNDYTFELFSVEGKIVMSEIIHLTNKKFIRNYSYTHLSNGVYFARIRSNENNFNYKLIIQR
jgi:hypothetical protein